MKSDSKSPSPIDNGNKKDGPSALSANQKSSPVDSKHIEEAITAVIHGIAGRKEYVDNTAKPDPVADAAAASTMNLGQPRMPSSFTDLPENLLDSSTPPFIEQSSPQAILTSSSSLFTPSLSRSGDESRLVIDKMSLRATTNQNSPLLSIAKSAAGHVTPVFASLTPVSVNLQGLLQMDHQLSNSLTTMSMVGTSSADISLTTKSGAAAVSVEPIVSGGPVPGISHLFSTLPSNLSGALATAGGISSSRSDDHSMVGLGHSSSSLSTPSQQDILFNNASTVLSAVPPPTALLSPSQLNFGVSPRNTLNLASIASSSGDYLSLQPAAVYVQPVNQNGQFQFLKVNFAYSPSPSAEPSVVSTLTNSSATNVISNNSDNTTNTVELTNNLIASILQQPGLPSSLAVPTTALKAQSAEHNQVIAADKVVTTVLDSSNNDVILSDLNKSNDSINHRTQQVTQQNNSATVVTLTPKKRGRSSSNGGSAAPPSLTDPSLIVQSSTTESGDEADDIYIDTKDLCSRIAYELKAHSIPQAIFAERVLCRSQGTLSDLLRNPKPWNKLKSGRETFRRMYQWLKQPLYQRLALLETNKEDIPGKEPEEAATDMDESDDVTIRRQSSTDIVDWNDKDLNDSSASIIQQQQQDLQSKGIKKPRLVFTDIQKRTLQAIFKETQRPSREMQQTIAEHLGLDLSTVQNFFMNARRRSRVDQSQSDSPAPYQQIRSITPPPTSPSPPLIELPPPPPAGSMTTIGQQQQQPAVIGLQEMAPTGGGQQRRPSNNEFLSSSVSESRHVQFSDPEPKTVAQKKTVQTPFNTGNTVAPLEIRRSVRQHQKTTKTLGTTVKANALYQAKQMVSIVTAADSALKNSNSASPLSNLTSAPALNPVSAPTSNPISAPHIPISAPTPSSWKIIEVHLSDSAQLESIKRERRPVT